MKWVRSWWAEPKPHKLAIFLYADSAGAADEAAQVAREVLARHEVSALVRTERWSPWEQQWQDATEDPSVDVAAERQLLDEYRKQRAREYRP